MQKEQEQQRADRIRAFQAELKTLEREKILTLSEDQRRLLAAYHYKLLSSIADDPKETTRASGKKRS